MDSLYNKLAPWDENSYFATPVPVFFTQAGGTRAALAGFNPRRIGLIISAANVQGFIAPQEQLLIGANVNVQQGIPISINGPPLMITQDDWGILVATAWSGVNPTGVVGNCLFTVVELILRDIPRLVDTHETVPNLIRQRAKPSRISPDYRAKLKQVWDQVLSSARRAGDYQ